MLLQAGVSVEVFGEPDVPIVHSHRLTFRAPGAAPATHTQTVHGITRELGLCVGIKCTMSSHGTPAIACVL